MADLDRRVLGLLEILVGAPGDPAEWLRFLEALRNEISPDAITLFAAQSHATRPGLVAGSGIGITQVQLGDWLTPSVPHPPASELPAGAVIDLRPGDRFQMSVLFREVLAPAGVLPGPGFVIVNERTEQHVTAATVVLPRSAKWKPGAGDRALLERLAPHMVTARRLHVRLAERSRDAEALISAFDRLVLGVVFVDENERVSYANKSAAELLGVAPGFTDAATLASPIPDERTRAWRRLLKSNATDRRSAMLFAHPEDGRPLQVLATRFSWGEQEGAAAARFGRAMFIGDPRRRSGDPAGILHELFGLTPSEARLALLLVADCSVEEAAGLLGITLATARGVLKTIFAKTGTNRQASLVRLLLSGPPGQIRSEGSDAPHRDPTARFVDAAVGSRRLARR
jgi:DNA-binding CsgD family transcriptional regulator